MKFAPHPIIPELLALLEKHKASISYTNADDGIHIHVGGEPNSDNGQDVFNGWAEQSFDLDDLREAAAQCPPAAAAPTLEALMQQHKIAIAFLEDRWYAFLFGGKRNGYGERYIDVNPMDADGEGTTPMEAVMHALTAAER